MGKTLIWLSGANVDSLYGFESHRGYLGSEGNQPALPGAVSQPAQSFDPQHWRWESEGLILSWHLTGESKSQERAESLDTLGIPLGSPS